MVRLLAGIFAFVAAYLPHVLLGDLLGPMATFTASTVVGCVAFAGGIWYLNRMRGGF